MFKNFFFNYILNFLIKLIIILIMSNKLKYINKNYKELPKLPSNLQKISCYNNLLLERLLDLPSSLIKLYIIIHC